MPLTQFLTEVNWRPSSFSNYYVAGKGNSEEYICAYVNRNKSKKEICKIMNRSTNVFDFHHVVEHQHLADISVDGMLDMMYDYEMPTVMMHNVKHHLACDAILHVKETRYRYLRKETASINVEQRQREAEKLFRSFEGRSELTKRVNEMKEIYAEVYRSEGTLRKIALNILNYYQDKFN